MSNEKQLGRIIEGALEQLKIVHDSVAKRTSSEYCKHYIRVLLPYGIITFKDGNSYMVNREYKPLGVGGYKDWVDYKDFQCEISNSTYEKIKTSRAYTHCNEAGIFIYEDANSPWESQKFINSYMKKLNIILEILKQSYNN